MRYIVVGKPREGVKEQTRAAGSVTKALKIADRLVAKGWAYAQVEDAPKPERVKYAPPAKRK
jgi:hypothetical protein